MSLTPRSHPVGETDHGAQAKPARSVGSLVPGRPGSGTVSPQHLIDGEIAELKRFGYAPFGDAAPDWEAMWPLLMGDFATLQRAHVPSYAEMTPWPQEGARIYMRRRLLADRLFEECQVLYARLHGEGINTELVEAYTLARDAYEEAVLDFGKARAMLEEVFTQTVDLAEKG